MAAKRSAHALPGLCALAFAALIYAYVTSDFSVINVALNSHTQKPLLYKIAGVWGNHEGSMLLWIFMLAAFGALIATLPVFNKDSQLQRRALGMQGLLAAGFIAFSHFTSNPFLRSAFAPPEGNSLNPVLQDPGLAFHPPTLYLGYVGFSSVFSLAAAALIVGRVDEGWARIVKPFAALAWLSLGAGIALGSFWAYYELGWGGWWFWDPVENASLLPWLTGTALIHCLAVLETRGALKRWCVLLAVITFSLSLLGTFLVRSGVLTSVHSFAVDPARGLFILGLLTLYCGGAFTLYAIRAPAFKTVRLFAPVSRESGIVANNLLLLTIAATILTGTLYPLILDAFDLGQISVGPPYYQLTVIPVALVLMVLMGAGPFLPWKRRGRMVFKTRLITALLTAAAALAAISAIDGFRGLLSFAGLAAALWLICASLLYLFQGFTFKNLATALGHLGLGIAVIGMLGTGLWKTEETFVVAPGEEFSIGRYLLRYDGSRDIFGPNYAAIEGQISLIENGRAIAVLKPQKRFYPAQSQETTEAAIRLRPLDDLYIVPGDAQDGKRVLRVQIHPFVSALWTGFALIVLSGMLMLARTLKR